MVRLDVEWENHIKKSRAKKKETFVKGVGLVEEEEIMSVKQINEELNKANNLSPLEQEDFLEKLVKKSGRKESSIKKQFAIIKKEEIERNKETNKILSDESVSKDNISLISKTIQFFKDKRHLAKQFLEIQPLYYDKNKIWWVWNKEEYRWILNDETDILNGIASSSQANTINSKERNEILEALKQESRLNKPQDIKSSWIQFKDKIYDIKTGENFEATSKYFVANPIPWKIGEEEDTPKINKLFESWVGKDEIQKLYEVFAFVTVPKYFIHSFFFLYSPPGYGKTTFENLLIKFIGNYNYTSTSIDRINKNIRFETKNWYKKLLITLDEVNNIYQLKNSSVINGATGESPIPGEFKGSNQDFKFINYAKFIYPTNKLLKVDADDGFGRRVRKIDFVNRFEKEKNVLEEIPDVEFKNLAKKSLRIAKELWRKRQFTGDVSISERMKNYQEASKTILEKFIDEKCDITDSNSYVPFDDFFVHFSKYLKEKNKDIVTKIKVSKELKQLGWERQGKGYKEYQDTLSGESNWITKISVLGIKFKEEKRFP